MHGAQQGAAQQSIGLVPTGRVDLITGDPQIRPCLGKSMGRHSCCGLLTLHARRAIVSAAPPLMLCDFTAMRKPALTRGMSKSPFCLPRGATGIEPETFKSFKLQRHGTDLAPIPKEAQKDA